MELRIQKPDTPSFVLQQLREIEFRLEQNRQLFDLAEDEDLIEACIYEEKALQKRYQYFWKLARRRGISARSAGSGQKRP